MDGFEITMVAELLEIHGNCTKILVEFICPPLSCYSCFMLRVKAKLVNTNLKSPFRSIQNAA